MRDTDRMKIREYIAALTEQGYLTQTAGSYPVLFTTERARAVLRGEERVTYVTRQEPSAKPAGRSKRDRRSVERNDGLFEALRNLRTDLARAEGVPAYVVFSNAALADMALLTRLSFLSWIVLSNLSLKA